MYAPMLLARAGMRARPVVKVYLLPKWTEARYRQLFNSILERAKGVPGWTVRGQDDLLVLFPTDRMAMGLGEEILVEVDLPLSPEIERLQPQLQNLIAVAIGGAVLKFLPRANIQCKVYPFKINEGFWSTS